jgi:predicted small secreted protein
MNKRYAIAFSTLVLLGASLALAGCNTTAGAGKDLSNTGKVITNQADKAKP